MVSECCGVGWVYDGQFRCSRCWAVLVDAHDIATADDAMRAHWDNP
ncbi:hypothetical protein ACVW07_003732 [Cellulomonas sp. URHB0016]